MRWKPLVLIRAIPLSLLIASFCLVASANPVGWQPLARSTTYITMATGWNYSVVDVGLWNAMVDMHLDSQNTPFVSYYPVGEVKMAEKEDDTWRVARIAETNVGGASLDLSIDSRDNPHVFYDHDIVIRHAMRTASGWNYYGAIDPSRTNDARPSSVMLDSDNGYLVYISEKVGSRNLRFGILENGSWSWVDVANLDRQDYLNPMKVSVALDSVGRLHVAYYDDRENELDYLRWTENGWVMERITSSDSGKLGWMPSLDVGPDDEPKVAFGDGMAKNLNIAERFEGSWAISIVDSEGVVGGSPSLSIDLTGSPHIAYEDYSNSSIKHAVRVGDTWQIETIYDDNSLGAKWPSLDLDSCGYPHIAFYVFSDETVRYASQGIPCPRPEPQAVSLNIDPDTLNLKSRGRWITAYLSTENASLYDIDISSIRLQDTLEAERYDYQDDILMLKFSRQEFKDTVQVGESEQVKITGKWDDGSEFEAYDHIMVI
ncbi:MAG: hypothetical protein ACE5KV_07705 [Thermoplasmata archaeon]